MHSCGSASLPPAWAKEYIFEVRTVQIFAINAGYSLLDLMIIGAIVGAWKKKASQLESRKAIPA